MRFHTSLFTQIVSDVTNFEGGAAQRAWRLSEVWRRDDRVGVDNVQSASSVSEPHLGHCVDGWREARKKDHAVFAQG